MQHSNEFSDRLNTKMFDAAEKGDINAVRDLLDRGAELETKDIDGWTVLMKAAYLGHLDLVQLLLERRANLEVTNENGSTVLMVASEAGRLDIVKEFLNNFVDHTVTNARGATALVEAACCGHIEVAEELLEYGADLWEKNTDNKKLMLSEAEKCCLKEVRELLLRHVNVKPMDNEDGETTLLLAAMRGQVNLVRDLLEMGANVNERDNNGNTALLLAASWSKNRDLVKVLLDRGADIDAMNVHGDTPLHRALNWGNMDVIPELIDRGADLSLKDNFGSTALIRVIDFCHPDVVQKVLNRGADVNASSDFGITALITAARCPQKMDLVNELLDRGADLEAKTQDGWTALMAAAEYDLTEMVQLLLSRGADPRVKDNKGGTAFTRAASKGNRDTASILRAAEKKAIASQKAVDMQSAIPNDATDQLSEDTEAGMNRPQGNKSSERNEWYFPCKEMERFRHEVQTIAGENHPSHAEVEYLKKRWHLRSETANKILRVFPSLQIIPGWALASFYYFSGDFENSSQTYGIPADWASLKEVDQRFFKRSINLGDIIVQNGGKEDFMEVVKGDGTPLSYLYASIFRREMGAVNSSGHNLNWWADHYVDEDTVEENMDRGELWEWHEEEPTDWRPTIKQTQLGHIVTFYTINYLYRTGIFRHIDHYPLQDGSLVCQSQSIRVASGQSGFVI